MKALSVLLFFGLIVLHDARRYRSDYSYYADVGGWLKFHRVPANWHEARLRCHLEGGHLASPISSKFGTVLKTLMEVNKVPDCGIFTGIHSTISRGDYAAIGYGTPLIKIPHTWAPGEPNNEGDKEQCIIMLKDQTIADASCEETFAYACFRKQTPNMRVSDTCGTVDNEYSLDSRTGNCYKFHTVPRTWSRAYMTCMAEGGHLVVINDEKEAAAVKDVFARFPAHKIPTRAPHGKDIIFVGFYDWNEHGEWRTVLGETLEQAGYSTFQGGEPNNATRAEFGGEFCGGVYRSGQYDDLWCEDKYSFICELVPNSLQWEESDLEQ